MGAGMEEIYQITSALKFLSSANSRCLTDARFSGVSPAPASATSARGARGRSDRPGPRRRPDPDRHRPHPARRLASTWSVRRTQFGAEEGRISPRARPTRPLPRPGPPRRHPPLGRLAGRRRRDLGGLHFSLQSGIGFVSTRQIPRLADGFEFLSRLARGGGMPIYSIAPLSECGTL